MEGICGIGMVGEDVEEEDKGVFAGGVGFVVEGVDETVDTGDAVRGVVGDEVAPGGETSVYEEGMEGGVTGEIGGGDEGTAQLGEKVGGKAGWCVNSGRGLGVDIIGNCLHFVSDWRNRGAIYTNDIDLTSGLQPTVFYNRYPLDLDSSSVINLRFGFKVNPGTHSSPSWQYTIWRFISKYITYFNPRVRDNFSIVVCAWVRATYSFLVKFTRAEPQIGNMHYFCVRRDRIFTISA